ncbi:MAG: transcriptional regulator [Candidatus Pelagibacter sp. TMED273]|nr:MAG: transcriptional regulator [Candidatus Pelagibacter sp. TMED273]|tara:strand:+ start:2608 stop:2949 length:342 start_codon:yes stop_codon:yes gene_type:complete
MKYKQIGEVAKILQLTSKKKDKLNTHTLRFWEQNFKQIKPVLINGNRRYYDDKTIELLKRIKFLLKEKGMTINGVKKILNNKDTFNLDEYKNKTIKTKLNRISNLINELKTYK